MSGDRYYINDHLGNTRIAFKDNNGDGSINIGGNENEILQETNYYPFGMSFAEGNINYSNKYLYNGKELQDNFDLNWYDYGARMYNAEIGRWNGIDFYSEKYFSFTPYCFVANNPLIFIDDNGKDFEIVIHHSDNPETNGTVEIKSTVYARSNDVDLANDAAGLWNGTDNFQYQTPDGAIYDIQFNITVVESVVPQFAAINDPSGNSFETQPDNSPTFENEKGGGQTGGKKFSLVKESAAAGDKGTEAAAHEVGHTMVTATAACPTCEGHSSTEGNVMYRSMDKLGSRIGKSTIQKILKGAGLGGVNSPKVVPELAPNIINNSYMPEGFENGKVIERPEERL